MVRLTPARAGTWLLSRYTNAVPGWSGSSKQ